MSYTYPLGPSKDLLWAEQSSRGEQGTATRDDLDRFPKMSFQILDMDNIYL